MIFQSRVLTLTGMLILGQAAHGQTLIHPREIGMGTYGASVRDSRGFSANPAGLVGVRDWEFSMTTYTGVSKGDAGFVFHGLTFGKKISGDDAAALQYTPGSALKLVLPPTLTISGNNTPSSNDRELSYDEPFALGFAHRFAPSIAAGIGGRFRQEHIADTQITLVVGDSIPLLPVAVTRKYSARHWALDVGVTWNPSEKWTVGGTGRSLFRLSETDLPDSLSRFQLPRRASGEIALAYQWLHGLRVVAGASTSMSGAAGYEWTPGYGLAVRNGVYFDNAESPFAYAISMSVGWSFDFFEIDASYIHLLNREKHSGTVAVNDFDASQIANLDVNPYMRDRLSLSLKAVFGNVRESLARIESVQMYGAVYPSSFEVFAYRPIGKVRVRNISGKPIRVRARFFVDRYMDAPTESQAVMIEAGAATEIDLMAVFNDRVKSVSTMTIREGDVYVNAVPTETYDDRAQTRVMFRGKNDWDGSVLSLRYFVTPDDPEVIRASRDMLLQQRDTLAGIGKEREPFMKARTVFNAFAGKLMYVADPKQSADFVQYPSETLRIKGGDCDDLTVCFASLLSSIGISTAFVDVVPPDTPEKSHIYLMFDTGLDPRYGESISENPKRYVVRRNKEGQESIWIPVETTVATRGFDEAWTSGAQKYFDDVEVGLGLVKGWVRILDVN